MKYFNQKKDNTCILTSGNTEQVLALPNWITIRFWRSVFWYYDKNVNWEGIINPSKASQCCFKTLDGQSPMDLVVSNQYFESFQNTCMSIIYMGNLIFSYDDCYFQRLYRSPKRAFYCPYLLYLNLQLIYSFWIETLF